MNTLVHVRRAIAAIFAMGALGACELEDPCDPGQEVKFGLCVDPVEPEEAGGAGGAGEDLMCEELEPAEGEANAGADCTEGGDECMGGTVCGAPRFPQCVMACGPCDFFFEKCPDGTTCFESAEGAACL